MILIIRPHKAGLGICLKLQTKKVDTGGIKENSLPHNVSS